MDRPAPASPLNAEAHPSGDGLAGRGKNIRKGSRAVTGAPETPVRGRPTAEPRRLPALEPDERLWLENYLERLKEAPGGLLKRLVVYGSKARGDAGPTARRAPWFPGAARGRRQRSAATVAAHRAPASQAGADHAVAVPIPGRVGGVVRLSYSFWNALGGSDDILNGYPFKRKPWYREERNPQTDMNRPVQQPDQRPTDLARNPKLGLPGFSTRELPHARATRNTTGPTNTTLAARSRQR